MGKTNFVSQLLEITHSNFRTQISVSELIPWESFLYSIFKELSELLIWSLPLVLLRFVWYETGKEKTALLLMSWK